jgi:bifunctional DNA-binding transcriptional regulator/antitoxin component of YhaV-PrlF toxin-antitoxin module
LLNRFTGCLNDADAQEMRDIVDNEFNKTEGQVIIPLDIRKQLGITPGCQLSFIIEGTNLRVEVNRRIQPTKPEEGYGLLVCKLPGERNLADFDVAHTMRDAK